MALVRYLKTSNVFFNLTFKFKKNASAKTSNFVRGIPSSFAFSTCWLTGYKTLRANLKMSIEKLLAQPESKF